MSTLNLPMTSHHTSAFLMLTFTEQLSASDLASLQLHSFSLSHVLFSIIPYNGHRRSYPQMLSWGVLLQCFIQEITQ